MKLVPDIQYYIQKPNGELTSLGYLECNRIAEFEKEYLKDTT